MTVRPSESVDDTLRPLVEWHRSRAERLLNGVRALVLLLLSAAAFAYAPTLPPERLRPISQAVEDAGLDALWVWEDCFKESAIASASIRE